MKKNKLSSKLTRGWKTTVIGLAGIAFGLYLVLDKKIENNLVGYGCLVGGLFLFFINDLSSWAEFKKITPFRVAGGVLGIIGIVCIFLGKDWTFVGGILGIAAGLFGGKFGGGDNTPSSPTGSPTDILPPKL